MVFDFNFLFPLMALAESNISASMEGGALFNIYMDTDAKGRLGQQCKV